MKLIGVLVLGFFVVMVTMKKYEIGFYGDRYTVNTRDSELLLIGHAGGSLQLADGSQRNVTNTKEAFYQNYKEGLRYFEGDLVYTSDGKIVLRHGWGDYLYDLLGQNKPKKTKKNEPISYKELMDNPIYGEYTSMDIESLVDFMQLNEDVYFIESV